MIVGIRDGNPAVRAFLVDVDCAYCQLKGYVPGGDRGNGELVPCPVCRGSKLARVQLSIDDVRALLATPPGPAKTGDET